MSLLPILLSAAILLQSLTASTSEDRDAMKARAESGDAKAQVELGIAYASGDGVTPDDVEAVKWFRKAAEKGDPAGEYSLGEMYLGGRGISADVVEGLKWIRRSAEHGDARGQANLAAAYIQGLGVPRDDAEAAKWMRKAAEQGLAAGQFGLGMMYAHGTGVPQDLAEAVRWYRKAVEQGDPPAMNNLAFLLATSNDTKIRNPKEAVALAQRAVGAGPDNAAFLDTLATAYFESGQPDKAAETEKRALTLDSGNPSYKRALERYLASIKH